MDAADYQAPEVLRDGRQVEIRSLRRSDRGDLLAAVSRTSGQSLYRRFFSPKRSFTQEEVAYFTEVDFTNHVALVAVVEADGQTVIIGGGRYLVTQPGKAEVAFVVVDEYQGQGVGKLLMRHLVTIARSAGLRELAAEVLAENIAMLRVFAKSGLPHRAAHDGGVVHITMQLR